ncbi:DUF6402 family protein [Pseudomonas putida]|uniref:Uncharacterized protein n=1 Tax=Pseudomonas putida TaxID=303 RepID=A0A1Q9R0M8_PSEPU|nr:DUF6402 family protein [Pseudomonas putida]OLS60852.1 hypothetical protein PSEMO_42550 [Pseudomonas putida]
MSLKDFQQATALGPDALFLLEGVTLDTLPGRDHPPKQIVIQALPLSKVPVAMRKMNWHTAAALMQRWFDSPAWQMPEAWKEEKTRPDPMTLTRAHCDEGIVKMSWAMGFARCREAVSLAASRIHTPNGVQRLNDLLVKAGWDRKAPIRLGDLNATARVLDVTAQVNVAPLGSLSDPLDDMYGALGQAIVKVCVSGRAFVEQEPGNQRSIGYFQVERLGFYIRDHYDFNGFQFLGIWTQDQILNRSELIEVATGGSAPIFELGDTAFASVTNGDFRKYRDKVGMGGDFLLYSDVLWVETDQIINLGPVS